MRKKIAISFVSAALILAMLAAWVGGFGKPAQSQGLIVISSVADGSFPLLDNYVLDIQQRKLVKADPSDTSQENMYSYSRVSDTTAFLGASSNDIQSQISANKHGDPMQVYVAKRDKDAYLFPTVDQATRLTNDISVQKMNPVISPGGGTIAYTSRRADAASTLSSTSTAGYSIVLINTEGTGSTTVPGIWPAWYSDDLFYYVASDGIRLYDIASGTSTLVIPIDGQANFKIAVSHDGGILAFSNPDSNSLFIYRISDSGLNLNPVVTESVPAYWMLFSPDDAQLAVQTADSAGPSMRFYDLRTFKQTGNPISLAPLDNDRLFANAWLQ